MTKMTNDNFDKILAEKCKNDKLKKARKEALRQHNVETYYNDYYNLVEREKRKLNRKNDLNYIKLFIIAVIIFIIGLNFYLVYFENMTLLDLIEFIIKI